MFFNVISNHRFQIIWFQLFPRFVVQTIEVLHKSYSSGYFLNIRENHKNEFPIKYFQIFPHIVFQKSEKGIPNHNSWYFRKWLFKSQKEMPIHTDLDPTWWPKLRNVWNRWTEYYGICGHGFQVLGFRVGLRTYFLPENYFGIHFSLQRFGACLA